MSIIRSRMIPIVVCLAIGLAACGSDSKSTTTDQPTTIAASDTTVAGAADTTVADSGGGLVLKRDGNFLVDGAGMTLYLFTNDPAGTSTCNVGCVDTWPPLLDTDGGFTVQGDLDPTDYSVITRDDGTTQITYQFGPLYYYSGDSAPGDRNGEGIGGVWFSVEFQN